MGFRDDVRKINETKQENAERAVVASGACPGEHYVTEVNKGSNNMSQWQRHLNEMYVRGYRLALAFEQDKNTVQVFEHHTH